MPRHTVQHVARLDVADDHEDLVVRHVALVVEVDDRLVRGAIEDLEIADHRVPRWMDRVDRTVEKVGHHVPPVVFVVGQLAANDLQFPRNSLGSKVMYCMASAMSSMAVATLRDGQSM